MSNNYLRLKMLSKVFLVTFYNEKLGLLLNDQKFKKLHEIKR
jgi:hypothetical protein